MRPTERPERPYTAEEILDRIEQHFVVEGNPRSASEAEKMCLYGGTGCAVGCLVTVDDATEWDSLGVTAIDEIIGVCAADVAAYFDTDTRTVDMLRRLQDAHDSANALDIKQAMRNAIASERERLEATP